MTPVRSAGLDCGDVSPIEVAIGMASEAGAAFTGNNTADSVRSAEVSARRNASPSEQQVGVDSMLPRDRRCRRSCCKLSLTSLAFNARS